MLIFGGASTDLDGPTSDLWSYTPSTSLWSLLKPLGSVVPSPREMHSSTSQPIATDYGFCFYVYGGRDIDGRVLSDLYRLDVRADAGTWRYDWVSLASGPSPRCSAGALSVIETASSGRETKLVLFGGFDGAALSDECLVYDVGKDVWKAERIGGGTARPCGRMAHATTTGCEGGGGGGKLIVVGGVAMEGDFADVYEIGC